jgi:signal transduction histidine kinase
MTKFYLTFFIIIVSLSITYAQKNVMIDASLTVNKMSNGNWEIFEEKEGFNQIGEVQKLKNWQPINHFPVTFPPSTKSVWLRTSFSNPSLNSLPIRIFTKGIDSLNVYWSDSLGKEFEYITGKNIPLSERFIASPYLVVPIILPAKSSTKVFVRIYNQSYHLSLPYLNVANPKSTNQYIKMGELGYNVYLGGLLLMISFSIILFLFFQERLYLFYLFCLIGSFIMVAIYNDYHYLFVDKIPRFIKNKNAFALLTTFLNILYLLFAEQYLKVDTRKNSKIIKFSRVIMGILLMLLMGFILAGKELFHYRLYFYPLFGANTLIMYYHLLQSIQKKYSPSWYFLVATTPIALVSILEVSSDFNGVPVQTIHDIYYAGTFIEMFFLTIGIVYRFRLERTNLQILQQELFVTEIKAQDRERERIARDLHDNIGASIVGIQMMLNAFSEKFFVDKETPEDFKKTIEYLEKTSHDIRELSHELTPQILTNLGLVEQIKEKYGFISKPVFKLTMPTETIILDPFIELTLYKIINEAVQNTLKHAEATEIGIELSKDNKNLKLRIEDNGIGFDLAQRKGNGIGLSNIKFRAENQLNGTLTIESSPGNGTIILVKINLKAIPKTVVQ